MAEPTKDLLEKYGYKKAPKGDWTLEDGKTQVFRYRIYFHPGDEKDAKVIRRLRDARLADPVNVEVSDTHGIETSLLTVADFKGRKILNYRYSELVFATQGGARFGMGPGGQDKFECGGILEFPGSPFCISASNVN